VNALRSKPARERAVGDPFEETGSAVRPFVVRQIAGAIARRIGVSGDSGRSFRGRPFGMIKLGSRTELVLPKKGLGASARAVKKYWREVTVLANTWPIQVHNVRPRNGRREVLRRSIGRGWNDNASLEIITMAVSMCRALVTLATARVAW